MEKATESTNPANDNISLYEPEEIIFSIQSSPTRIILLISESWVNWMSQINMLLTCNTLKKYRFRSGLQYLLSWRMHWHLTKNPEVAFNLHKGDQISFPLICLKAGWDSQIHLFKQMLVRQIYTGKSLGDW